jgi:hypothetical protein
LHLGSPVVSLVLLGLAAVTVPIFFLVEPAQVFQDRASHNISLSHLLPSTLLSQLALASSALIAPLYMYRTLSLSFFDFPTFSAYTALNSPASITRAVKEKEKGKGKSKEDGLSHLNRPLKAPSQHRYSLEDLKIVWLSPLVPLLYGISTFIATYSLLCEFYEGWKEESSTSFSFDREQILGYCTWLQIALGSFFFFIWQYKDFQARYTLFPSLSHIRKREREAVVLLLYSFSPSFQNTGHKNRWLEKKKKRTERTGVRAGSRSEKREGEEEEEEEGEGEGEGGEG